MSLVQPLILLASTMLAAPLPLPAQKKGGSSPPPNPAIAFQSGGTLFVMNHDGSNQRAVVTGATTKLTMEPAWSPDGTEIAFAGTPGNQPSGIWAVRPDGTGLRRIAALPAGFDADLSWSPVAAADGRHKIAFVVPDDATASSYSYEVFLANADGSGVAQLTHTADHEVDVCWAPDAQRLAVTALAMNDGAKPYCAVLTLGIDAAQSIVVTGRTEVTRVAGSPIFATDGLGWSVRDPDWARHSDRLLLSVRKPGLGDDLWIVDLGQPAAPVRLNPNGGSELFGCWSPDDSQICYRRTGGGRNAEGIYKVAANGTGAVQLQRGGHFPDWRRTQ